MPDCPLRARTTFPSSSFCLPPTFRFILGPISHSFTPFPSEDLVNLEIETDIQGYDIDDHMVEIARENAKRAGVEKLGGLGPRNW